MFITPHQVYKKLYKRYGPQQWWPADTPFEVMVGAILTQNTAWENVEKAIRNLKAKSCLNPQALLACTPQKLSELIRPAGYFNVKTVRLKNFCSWYVNNGEFKKLQKKDTQTLRSELLAINGVGPETADDILLYAFLRPVFVIDAYTRRLFQRLNLIQGTESYEDLRSWLEGSLTPDVQMWNEYHGLIVKHAKEHCRKTPKCEACHLKSHCGIGRNSV